MREGDLPEEGPESASGAPETRAPTSYADAMNRVSASVEDTLLASDRPVRGAGVATPTSGAEVTQVGPPISAVDATQAAVSGHEATLYGEAAVVRARPVSRREAPAKIGRYLVIEPIGEGGMGVVFAAYDPQLDRKVAIKLVRPAYTETSGGEAQARLMREAQALAKLRHPNIVTVYEVGAFGDEVFVAMEFVDGVTLRTWQFEHARSWREVVRVYVAAGRGLAAAHQAGLVHRDFKPDNVLVTRDGEPRVLDFGLAFRDPSAPAKLVDGGQLGESLTLTGALVGTPAYMAPEQFRGGQLDPRTDVFAFCVALYEALYGGRPYAGTTVAEICVALFEGRISAPPPFVTVPTWLRRVVLRGLRLEAKDRPQDMEALLNALGRDPARYLLVASVVLVVGGIFAALVLALRSAEGRQSQRDQGARARADFDAQRAELLAAELTQQQQRGVGERYNAWVVAAARARLGDAPVLALAGLKHLRADGGSLAEARGVAAEAVMRGVPAASWTTGGTPTAVGFCGDAEWVVVGDVRGRVELRGRGDGSVWRSLESGGPVRGLVVASRTEGEPRVRVAVLGDGRATLWDATGATSRVIGGDGSVLAVALAPDGERVASGGADGRLKISAWDGEGLHSFTGHSAPIQAIQWASDGAIATGDADGHVIVWDLAANSHREVGALESRVSALEFDAVGQLLYAVGGDRRGAVLSLARGGGKPAARESLTGVRVAGHTRLELGADGVATLAFAAGDPRRLLGEGPALAIDLDATARWAAVVRAAGVEIWDASPRPGRILTASGHRLARLTFAASGRWLAGTSDDGGVHLWSVADGTRTIAREAGPVVDALFFTADERSLVFADRLPRLTAWDLATKQARELPFARAARQAIDARPLADGGVLQWNRSEYEAAVQAFAPDGERRFALTLDDAIRLAELGADGRRLAVSSGSGRPEFWRVDGDRLTREAIDLGDAQHRWQAIAQAEDGGWTRLAATLEPEAGQVAGFVVYEVLWPESGSPTAHLLHEDDAARAVVVDPASGSVIVVGEGRRELWQLHSGAVARLPVCAAQIHGFAVAPDRRTVVVLGAGDGRSVSDTACFVDLASGSQHRWTTSGDPWAWDGRRTLASVFRGAEVDLRGDPTPDEADAFLRWLAAQTRRELPLAALTGQ